MHCLYGSGCLRGDLTIIIYCNESINKAPDRSPTTTTLGRTLLSRKLAIDHRALLVTGNKMASGSKNIHAKNKNMTHS